MESNLDLVHIILNSSWVVQSILILLLVLSLTSWAIVFYYLSFYKKVFSDEKEYQEFYASSMESATNESLKFFVENCKRFPRASSALLAMHIFQDLKKSANYELKKELLEKMDFVNYLNRVISQFNLNYLSEIDRHRNILANISTTAPFIGLLGTVLGIVGAFSGMSTGAGSIESIAPGIAEALVATAVGLAAAIPASWFFNYFAAKLKRVKVNLENHGNEFFNLINRMNH